MVFHKVLWWCPQVDNDYERNSQLQNSKGHELYVPNQTQPFALEHRF
jgi:hypothetical protein